MSSSPLPRRLPITVPPAQHEILASYLRRLAGLNAIDGDDLWRQATEPGPTATRRIPDARRLAALTGRPPGHLAGALLELRDPPPTWEAFRHNPQIGCARCDARHPGGKVLRIFPHHRYVCLRHRIWIGPPDLNKPGPLLEPGHELLRAQRRHQRLVRRHGWAATYDAVLTAFVIYAQRWTLDKDQATNRAFAQQAIWDIRSHALIPEGTENNTYSAARLFAAIYCEAVELAEVLADPHSRELAAGDDTELELFLTHLRRVLRDPDYQPSAEGDAIAHWIEQDCWRPPSPPPTTFAKAPGNTRPSQLGRPPNIKSLERHADSLLWFKRKRNCGSVILHHRTVHPVIIREWSIEMERFAGAIWQSQRTLKRFRQPETTEPAK